MARIIYQTEFDREDLVDVIDFNQALRIIKGFMGTEDTLDALQGFEKRYEKREIEAFKTDDYGFDHEWRYEIYSYNLLVEGFGKLFAPKEA
ncbi:hypothetical protein YFHUAIHA_CDS0111 [Phage C48C1]|nr:hypothetical protein YFHUAIHA_CDS0111 [Phage C48C1]